MPAPRTVSPSEASSAFSSALSALFLGRAIAGLLLGAAVTFSATNHSAAYGSVVFGAWAVIQSIVLIASAVRDGRGPGQRILLAQGVLGGVIGAAALALTGFGLGALLLVVTAFAAVTGALELYRSIRIERGTAVARESLFVGVLTAVLAIVFLAIPPDEVLAVGLIGGYGIVVGVYLAIAGISLRLPASRSDAARADGAADQVGSPDGDPLARGTLPTCRTRRTRPLRGPIRRRRRRIHHARDQPRGDLRGNRLHRRPAHPGDAGDGGRLGSGRPRPAGSAQAEGGRCGVAPLGRDGAAAQAVGRAASGSGR